MPAAGEPVYAGLLPNQRVATAEITADSVNFTTTETVLMTVLAPVIAGRRYSVYCWASFQSSSSGDGGIARLRFDNTSGTELTSGRFHIEVSAAANGYPCPLYVEFNATATGLQTIVLTGIRSAGGAGNVRVEAATNRPSYIIVNQL